MNSSSTTTLRNIYIDITKLHIFQLSIRILTFRDEEDDRKYLKLIFDNANGEEYTNLIKINRTYRTISSVTSTLYI